MREQLRVRSFMQYLLEDYDQLAAEAPSNVAAGALPEPPPPSGRPEAPRVHEGLDRPLGR